MKYSVKIATSMIQCSKCGQANAEESQFCRFCGIKFPNPEPYQPDQYTYEAPRPYSWKTDEYQTQSEPRVKPRVAPTQPSDPQQTTNPFANAQPLAYGAPQYLAQNYRCPNCGTTALPITERRISTAGWVTFSLLLVFTFIFFWIGLLMKENVSICPVCRIKLN
ncbi:MAG: LITAF-like zinc ribbon domain-containing protein [Pyrinomonadaceae bacterium]